MPPTTNGPTIRAGAGTGPDDLLRVGALTLGIHLGIEDIAAFRVYREELLRWSERMNLTALATPADIVRQGFLDSLACAPLLPPRAGQVLDVGSGAGFPAIPLALTKPALEFTLVEPSRKKVTFLRHAVRELYLRNVRIRHGRIEALLPESDMLEGFDVAIARAVAPLDIVGQMVLPFLRPGGVFLAQTGAPGRIREAVGRLRRAGFEVIEERAVPDEFGKPGRRVLALQRSGVRRTPLCFT